jgi:tripartite-type tricarboxylate transporter receptor subunit TctC
MLRPIVLAALALVGAVPCLAVETYPSRPVHVIVPYAPGGSTDMTARVISQQLSLELNQSFVVENKTGAGSTIGDSYVAKAPPDGYTLLLADQSLVLAPHLYKSLTFDVIKDFTPITEIGRIPAVLVVNPSLNIDTLDELVKYARANPGKLNYGSAGTGGAVHLATELFKRAANIDITHVPYNGGGGAMMSGVVGNHVQLVLTALPTVLPFVKSGQLKALAVTTSRGKRSSALPDVPSMAEAGLPDLEVYFWYGLAGPAGMPPEAVETIARGVQRSLDNPNVRDKLLAQGAELVGAGPADFGKLLRSEVTRWDAVFKTAGIKID